MKSLFSLLFLVLVFTSCYTNQNNCKKYHTGTFIYQTYANGELMQTKVVRNDSMEISFYENGNPDTTRIRWINDCEYILTKYHADSLDEKQAFQMKIISTKENSYTFEFSKVGSSKKTVISAKRVTE